MWRFVCRGICVSAFCLLFLLSFAACAPKKGVFDTFLAGYTAEVEGELYGMPFSAKIEMAAARAEGKPPATVTFYAPEALSGTVVTRGETGEITVKSGSLTLADSGGIGAALFSLFPTAGEIVESEIDGEGQTRLTGEGFVLTLLADGTPLAITTDAVRATVVRFVGN